jgi:Fe2+ or Zn2+ uptake regulation protein
MPLSAEKLLREHGLRVTPQRLAVLELFLSESGFHRSADQIRNRLLPHIPGLARGTTYKVLQELVNAHICEELPTPEGLSLYGIRLEPHHHFVCRNCHRWFDIDVKGVEDLHITSVLPGFGISEVAVTFHGICSNCRSANEAR